MYGILKYTFGKSNNKEYTEALEKRLSSVAMPNEKFVSVIQKKLITTERTFILLFLVHGNKKSMCLPNYEKIFNDLDSAKLYFELL